MRPSAMSRSRARRATSRRTGSKADRPTASGVSSTMMFTPVTASKDRMLRPSRPMMRPFMSSEGSGTTDTVVSVTTSEARRWMEVVRMRRARRSASSRAFTSRSRSSTMASCRPSSSTRRSNCSLAALASKPAICSSSRRGLLAQIDRRRGGSRRPRARAGSAGSLAGPGWRRAAPGWPRAARCAARGPRSRDGDARGRPPRAPGRPGPWPGPPRRPG